MSSLVAVRTRFALLGLLLWACAGLLAQVSNVPQRSQTPAQPSQPLQAQQPGTYTLQVNTQAVVLDIVVTDKKGKTVTGLSREDFNIFEDKAPQAIKSFEAPSARAPLAGPIDSTQQLDKDAPNASVMILVLDEINTKFEDEVFAKYSLKKYLDTMGDTLPEPMLLVAVNMSHFIMLHDYTTSKKELLAAIDHHVSSYPWRQQGGDWKAEQFNAAVASVMEIAQATGGHPGHKGLIWVGRGFPSFDPVTLTPDMNAALQTTIEICTNALRDARVVMYTLDPAGVTNGATPEDEEGFYEGDPFGGQIDFNAIARETGGESFFGRNDVDKLIGASARDSANFYTLSYNPKRPDGETKPFHNIRVVMRDPSLHAATRQGYYTRPASETVGAVTHGDKLSSRELFDLTVAGQSTMVYDAVPMTVTRVAASDQFTVTVDANAVPWEPSGAGRLKGNITLLVECFDKKGKQVSQRGEEKTVEIAADPSGAPGVASVSMPTSVATKAPAARLRFVVRLDNGKIGAANVFLVDEKTLVDAAQ